MKPQVPTRVRWLETTLFVMGLSLLAIAVGATWDRWSYQAQQRALLESITVEPREVTQRLTPSPAPDGPAITIEPEAVTPRKRERVSPPDPALVGLLEIPSLGISAVVKRGADARTLRRAVGLVPEGAQPGEPGNVVLAGHRDTFFRPLRDIEVNDRIRLVMPHDAYEYRVDWVRIVSPDETSVLESHGVEELTLVTCYPFAFVGPAPDRFIVRATRVRS